MPTTSNPNSESLLHAYCAEQSEGTFEAVVQPFGGLIYSGALRRTGNSHLAEEVAQNVLAIFARKAYSLRNHPSITAWLFKTTRYEAAQLLRSERRHHRKIAEFSEAAETPQVESPLDHAFSPWRDALPVLDEALDNLPSKDRSLIFQRYFENKKFSTIARSNGRSVAACKMQLKRTLQKLCHVLSARGVTLSATVRGVAQTDPDLSLRLLEQLPAGIRDSYRFNLMRVVVQTAGTQGATEVLDRAIERADLEGTLDNKSLRHLFQDLANFRLQTIQTEDNIAWVEHHLGKDYADPLFLARAVSSVAVNNPEAAVGLLDHVDLSDSNP